MIDARRWVIAETWLSLGLRIKWASYAERNDIGTPWQEDEDGRKYIYGGDGVWHVRPDGRAEHRTPTEPPTLHADTLLHELAHYLTSTAEERWTSTSG